MPFILLRLTTVVVLLSLLVYLPSATAGSSNKCLEFESLDEIFNHATKKANVLININKEFASDEYYEELCRMYENTSEERIRGRLVIGHVMGDLHRDLAKDLGAENEDSWPTLVLVKEGTQRAIVYSGDKKVEAIAQYLKKETGITIGTFVYSLSLFDGMAIQFVKIQDNDNNKYYAGLYKKLIAYTCKYLSYVMSFRADADTKVVAGMYVNVFMKSLEEGDYAKRQSERLKNLTTDEKTMSAKKREEMNQKLHILSKFTNPVELTPKQQREFYAILGFNVMLLVAFFFMSIQLVTYGLGGGGGDSQNDGEDEKETSEGAADQDSKKDDLKALYNGRMT